MARRKKALQFTNLYLVDPSNYVTFKRIPPQPLSTEGVKKYLLHLKKVKKYHSLDDYHKLEVVKHPKMGYGVFVKDKLKKHEVICHYCGEICSSAKANEDYLDNSYLFALAGCGFPRFSRWLINAEEKGNISRFINHSEENSNLTHHIHVLPCEELNIPFPYVFFVATRDIHPGEQLFYDYGKEYWKHMGITPFEE